MGAAVTAGRFETWLLGLVSDRERLARWFVVGYWLSTLVVLLGGALIIGYFLGWRP